MRYMLLLYSAENAGPEQGSPEQAAEMKEWFAYTEAMRTAGAFLAGDPLHGIETATTITAHDGNVISTDGPFAETKEILGGYYMVDVENLDQATEWAEKCPIARYGSVEVRPIMEMG